MHVSIKGSETEEDDKGKPYTVYLIEIRGVKGQIKKRYSDFAKFHEQMQKLKTPGFKLPALPGKKWTNNMDPTFVFNRGLDLEEYLRQFVLAGKGRPEEQLLMRFLVDPEQKQTAQV